MCDDLHIVLLSEPSGVKLESCVHEGRTVFCAPPGEAFSIRVTANDPAKFRKLLSSNDRKYGGFSLVLSWLYDNTIVSTFWFRVHVRVYIDGLGIGYFHFLGHEVETKFTYMRSNTGCYQLKFKETAVDDTIEDLAVMKANAAKQWTSTVGTICVNWDLYSQGEELESVTAPAAAPADQTVGATLKFWQRPSAALQRGEAVATGRFCAYRDTIVPGVGHSGSSTVWFHTPAVFAVFQNLAATGAINTVAPLPVHADDDRDDGDVVEQLPAPACAPAELVDLTSVDAETGCAYKADGNGVIDLMDSDAEHTQPAKRVRRAPQQKTATATKKAAKKKVVKREAPIKAAANTSSTAATAKAVLNTA